MRDEEEENMMAWSPHLRMFAPSSRQGKHRQSWNTDHAHSISF